MRVGMSWWVAAAGIAILSSTATATEPPGCSIAVMSLTSNGATPPQAGLVPMLTEALAFDAADSSGCQIVTQSEINQMMDFEAQKQACGEGESCLAEIGSALGVERIIGGSVSFVGETTVVTARLMNLKLGRVESRAEETVQGSPEHMRIAAKNVSRKLFGRALIPLAPAAAPAPTKPPPEEPTTTSGDVPSPLLGAGVAAAGGLLTVGAVVTGLVLEASLADAEATTETKDRAQTLAPYVIASAGAGMVTIAVGAVTAGFSWRGIE